MGRKHVGGVKRGRVARGETALMEGEKLAKAARTMEAKLRETAEMTATRHAKLEEALDDLGEVQQGYAESVTRTKEARKAHVKSHKRGIVLVKRAQAAKGRAKVAVYKLRVAKKQAVIELKKAEVAVEAACSAMQGAKQAGKERRHAARVRRGLAREWDAAEERVCAAASSVLDIGLVVREEGEEVQWSIDCEASMDGEDN